MRPGLQKLAILAGGGSLPRDVADACKRDGVPFVIFDIGGAADQWAEVAGATRIELGQVGRLLDTMRAEGCDSVTMAGPLTRPQLSKVRFDWQGVKVLPRVARLFRQGDDALLRGIAEILEENGFRVFGAEHFLSDALSADGVLTGAVPDATAREDIDRARAILNALGAYDVGQAVVVADGVCIAIEAAEGTAKMLERVAALRPNTDRSGVLVKIPKPQQDRRFDLPAIGSETAAAAAAAGLKGIAIEAGGAFILDRDETIRRCNEAGLFLVGLSSTET